MKKLFFFAIVALGMTAACQKQNVENSDLDDAPVAVQFNVSSPTFTVTKTKSPVEAWSNQTVYVYGYKKDADFSNTTDTGLFLIDNEENGNGASGTIAADGSISFGSTNYYYSGTNVYNFNAYYIDNAAAENAVKAAEAITRNITITGTQDVMVATTDPAKDKGDNDEVNENRIYSAYAARRGVHPTLNFQHMLTRFNFTIKKGQSTNDDTKAVLVNSISVKSPDDLTLQVAPTPSLTTTQSTVEDYADLAVVFPNQATSITPGEDVAADAGNIMIYPGLSSITINLGLTAADINYNESMPITLNATDVLNNQSQTANKTKFLASEQYNIEITVYDLEKVTIKATLGDWEEGGNLTYDPDDYWPGE